MAHYAFLDSNSIVTEVIVGQEESNLQHDWEIYYGNIRNQVCKRTSYNTYEGTNKNGGVALRKNYAGVGYTYDSVRDAFIPPKPFPSWILNETTCNWDCSVPYPTTGVKDENGRVIMHQWEESSLSWVSVS